VSGRKPGTWARRPHGWAGGTERGTWTCETFTPEDPVGRRLHRGWPLRDMHSESADSEALPARGTRGVRDECSRSYVCTTPEEWHVLGVRSAPNVFLTVATKRGVAGVLLGEQRRSACDSGSEAVVKTDARNAIWRSNGVRVTDDVGDVTRRVT
jgi:hypothetical protein